ncbi:MAG: hypothetical protein ACK4N5_04585, partial [Myxococcales bacterium]
MNHRLFASLLALCATLAFPAASFAQDRGRTDGPEGSEYGKGGYDKPSGGRFSLSLDWGGALSSAPLTSAGAPIFVGINAGW